MRVRAASLLSAVGAASALNLSWGTETSEEAWLPSAEEFESTFSGISNADDVHLWKQLAAKHIHDATSQKLEMLENSHWLHRDWRTRNRYPFWGFIPEYMGTIFPDSDSLEWQAECFGANTAQAKVNTNKNRLEVLFHAAKPSSWFCSDFYLFATPYGIHFRNPFMRGSQPTMSWKLPTTGGEAYDLKNKGVRVFKFVDGPADTLRDLLATVLLFGTELTKGVPDLAAELNIRFMNDYSQIKPPAVKRKQNRIEIDESLIQSGDFFGIRRYDGLDPMLAWAMGSTTGHTTVALRVDGELYIAESTTKDSYWPTNGIQITPYKQWMDQAEAAGFAVVYAPLSQENRRRFNETAAHEWVQTVLGLDYGYANMLWAWVDTVQDNYPCLPPSYSKCLRWEHFELIVAWVDRLVPSIGQKLFLRGWNKHISTNGLRALDLYAEAGRQGIAAHDIPLIVERDEWTYETTRYGEPTEAEAMVCCVFVCRMWKAAGIFSPINNDVNCAEFTNYDVYSLDVFEKQDTRPEVCKEADPENELCQLLGDFTLILNDYNSRKMAPRMAESCPSQAPDYTHPDFC